MIQVRSDEHPATEASELHPMNPAKPDRGVRPGLVFLVAGIFAATLAAIWFSQTSPTPAAAGLDDAVGQPSVTAANRASSGGGAVAAATVPPAAGPRFRLGSRVATENGADLQLAQIPTSSNAAPILVGPDGNPTPAYAQYAAQAAERVLGGAAGADPSMGAIPADPAASILPSAQALSGAEGPDLATGPAPEFGVDSYRRNDLTRRALVEEMRQVRRAMLVEASRQNATNQ
jgi:hypothetical protein